ncbi:cation transporter [Bacillus pfraonensis]
MTISVIVAVLILKSAWGVTKHSIHILMEGTPVSIELSKVKRAIRQIEGVRDVHDLHIWTITSGLDALSCHVMIDKKQDYQEILQMIINMLKQEFHIEHTTIQIETLKIKHNELVV